MVKQTLKAVLGKRNDVTAIVTSLIQQLNAAVFIQDADGKLLLGNPYDNPPFVHTVPAEDGPAGFVKGDANAGIICKLVIFLFNKEKYNRRSG